MAAALAASLPAPVQAILPTAQTAPTPTKVPQRLEGVVDAEAARDVEAVSLNSLVCTRLLSSHSYHHRLILFSGLEAPLHNRIFLASTLSSGSPPTHLCDAAQSYAVKSCN